MNSTSGSTCNAEEQPFLCLVTARSVEANTGWLRDPGFVDFIGPDRLLDCVAAQLDALPSCLSAGKEAIVARTPCTFTTSRRPAPA